MPVQQQMSSFAKKLGGRVSQANEEHRDKPVDTGNRRLPPGIRDGIARLSSMYTKEYEDDKNGPGTKGQTFFRASAIVISPAIFNGEKIAGLVTSFMVPLCDMPEKGLRKAKSFDDNWYEFQNLFKLLGVAPCPETKATDPTGQRTEAYFFAAMKTLVDPVRMKANPVYISFSTRGWTPKPTQAQPKPEEMVFETWHGLAQFNGQVDPGSGVADSTASQPPPMSPPPSSNHQPRGDSSPAGRGTAETTPTDPADEVASLVEVAMSDPEGATEDGGNASARLEELAWERGWTKEQTASATDWAQVGEMALNSPTQPGPEPTQPTQPATTPVASLPATDTVKVGDKFRFAKRSKDGAKLKNNKGEEFPPQDVEVVSVDPAAMTCTVKTKDGKDVTDIRTKKPVDVKFEWLEQPILY